MKRTTRSKLTLDRESMRVLTGLQLSRIHGGEAPGTIRTDGPLSKKKDKETACISDLGGGPVTKTVC
jgi:hypothetical protein